MSPEYKNTEEAMHARWEWFVEMLALVQKRVRMLAEVPPYVDFCFQEVVYDEQAVQKLLTEEHRQFLRCVAARLNEIEWGVAAIESTVRDLLNEPDRQLKVRLALLALRVAVSGRTISPPLFEIMYLLGRERVERRLLRW